MEAALAQACALMDADVVELVSDPEGRQLVEHPPEVVEVGEQGLAMVAAPMADLLMRMVRGVAGQVRAPAAGLPLAREVESRGQDMGKVYPR